MTGKVKKLTDRGFGFIVRDGAKKGDADYFFHAKSMGKGMFETLVEGQSVSFDEDRDDEGRLKAINIVP